MGESRKSDSEGRHFERLMQRCEDRLVTREAGETIALEWKEEQASCLA